MGLICGEGENAYIFIFILSFLPNFFFKKLLSLFHHFLFSFAVNPFPFLIFFSLFHIILSNLYCFFNFIFFSVLSRMIIVRYILSLHLILLQIILLSFNHFFLFLFFLFFLFWSCLNLQLYLIYLMYALAFL